MTLPGVAAESLASLHMLLGASADGSVVCSSSSSTSPPCSGIPSTSSGSNSTEAEPTLTEEEAANRQTGITNMQAMRRTQGHPLERMLLDGMFVPVLRRLGCAGVPL